MVLPTSTQIGSSLENGRGLIKQGRWDPLWKEPVNWSANLSPLLLFSVPIAIGNYQDTGDLGQAALIGASPLLAGLGVGALAGVYHVGKSWLTSVKAQKQKETIEKLKKLSEKAKKDLPESQVSLLPLREAVRKGAKSKAKQAVTALYGINKNSMRTQVIEALNKKKLSVGKLGPELEAVYKRYMGKYRLPLDAMYVTEPLDSMVYEYGPILPWKEVYVGDKVGKYKKFEVHPALLARHELEHWYGNFRELYNDVLSYNQYYAALMTSELPTVLGDVLHLIEAYKLRTGKMLPGKLRLPLGNEITYKKLYDDFKKMGYPRKLLTDILVSPKGRKWVQEVLLVDKGSKKRKKAASGQNQQLNLKLPNLSRPLPEPPKPAIPANVQGAKAVAQRLANNKVSAPIPQNFPGVNMSVLQQLQAVMPPYYVQLLKRLGIM